MSISVYNELQLFAQEVKGFSSPNALRDLIRNVGFVQRTSKYQAKDLVALCIWMSQMHQLLLMKKKRELSEYKDIYI